jgi:hypothetical protein
MPLHVVGEHAEGDVCPHALFEVVMDGTNV